MFELFRAQRRYTIECLSCDVLKSIEVSPTAIFLAGIKKDKGDWWNMDLHANTSFSDHGCEKKSSHSDQSHHRQNSHTTGKDTIVLPSRAAAMQQAQKIAQEAPETRKELVDQIKQGLELGTLTLDSHLVAEKLIGIVIADVSYAA